MRASYWSNSKLSRWIRQAFRMPVKPTAATMEEWDTWRDVSKKYNKVVYWVAEDGLDLIQDILNYPKDKLNDFACWVHNRFISKTHIIRTGLEKGMFHETEEKIIHGIFSELVDFVEIQKAVMSSWSHPEKRTIARKFLPYFIYKFVPFRSQQLGVDYLLWEITLKKDEDWCSKDDPAFGQPTEQAKTAQRILDAYVWWKFIRPMREDPHDASGYTSYLKGIEEKYGSWFPVNESKEDKEVGRITCEKAFEIEKQYDDEDEFYLKEVIEIRKSLWT